MMNTLKIGDSLYKYFMMGGIAEYKVLGIHTYANRELYHLHCLACTHGRDKCEMTVASTDREGIFTFVHMLNNDGDDDDDCNEDQTYWHTCLNSSDRYFSKKEACILAQIANSIDYQKKTLKEAEERLAREKKSMDKMLEDQKKYRELINKIDPAIKEE